MKEKTMKENEGKPPGLQLAPFLDELDQIRRKYHIIITDRITPEIEARRIAILIANCYLKYGGNIHQAGFLERKIYEAVKMLDLTCGPIEEEIRFNQNGGKRGKDGAYLKFNPLKLAIEGKGGYLTGYSPLIYLIIRKLNTLEEKKDERIPKLKNRRLDQRRAIGRAIQDWPFNHKTMENRKKFALRKVG